MSVQTFHVADYICFGFTLAVPVAIGIYHACAGGKQKTTSEFLLGDRKMQCFPVALSMIASFVSAIALLGNPSEVYANGMMLVWMNVSHPFVMLISAHLFLPVLYPLGINSVYEYLDMRFNRVLRIAGATTFTLFMILYMAVVLYAPALAVSAVTGLNLWLSIVSVGIVCTFYTALGGLKAVVWTDVFQTLVMLAGMLMVLIQGSIQQGGFQRIWQIASESGRTDFLNASHMFDPDPRQRYTFWNLAIGSIFTSVGIFVCSQTQFQRAASLPKLKKAQIALWLNWPGMTIFTLLGALCGLVLYANYKDCDPKQSGMITSNDQLLPLFVMEMLSSLPGLPGIFVACIFSGSLSTISSGLNSLAAVALEDVIKVFIKPNIKEDRMTLITKFIATCFGAVTIGFAALIASLGGTLIVIVMTMLGVLTSPLIAVYTLGMFCPCANSVGAFVGMLSGMCLTLWLQIGSMVNRVRPLQPMYPVSVEGCLAANSTSMTILANGMIATTNMTSLDEITTTGSPQVFATEGFSLNEVYRVSFAWYGALNFITVLMVGLLVSLITRKWSKKKIDQRLLSPLVRRICQCEHTSASYDMDAITTTKYRDNDVREDEELDIAVVSNGSLTRKTSTEKYSIANEAFDDRP